MGKAKRSIISVQGTEITVISASGNDFISLTDMLKAKDGDFFISDWLRNRNTVEFLGIWEEVNNPKFNYGEFAVIKSLAGLNSYKISLSWNLNRTLSKLNYRIQTNAIRELLIPFPVSAEQASITYANEADLLNVALFSVAAKEWRERNPDKDGNIRDYATIEQLLVLANIEGMNAEFIRMGLSQSERIIRLNEIAIRQMQVLIATPALKQLKE